MVTIIRENEPKAGTLRKPELFALAIGQVIGAGVITLIVPAIKMTGYSAWLAYFFAIIMGFIMIMPTLFISSVVRMGGGNYSMLAGMAGPKVAGMFSFIYLTQALCMSLFGTAAAAYMGDIIPALGSHTARILVGSFLLTFFYVINLMGINIMAKVQKLMTWLLIAALVLFAIVGCFKIKLPVFNFADPDFLINGWGMTFKDGRIIGGFMGAMLLFVYSTQGYYMTIAYGRDSENARRDIPIVLLLAVPTLIVLYVGVAIAGVGVLSVSEYGDSSTLVYAARKIFSPAIFYVFIIGGPIMALLSTLNSSYAYNAITIGQSCDDGWLPSLFGKRNKRGARIYILTFMYVLGIIPILFGLSITVITNMTQLLMSSFAILNFFAYIKMPKLYPQAWKKSRFHLPDGLYYTICIISLAGFLIVLWKACLSMKPSLALMNIGAIAVLAVIGLIRGKTGDVKIKTSLWAETGENNGE